MRVGSRAWRRTELGFVWIGLALGGLWQSGSALGSGFSCDGILGKSFSPAVFPGAR